MGSLQPGRSESLPFAEIITANTMDRTYSEATGHAPFDWNKWLDAAIADPESVTQKEHERVRGLSFHWVTCACGNQCAIIPRIEHPIVLDPSEEHAGPGMPEDTVLANLGGDFHANITTREWSEAKQILRDIEIRADLLIKEELAKLNQR